MPSSTPLPASTSTSTSASDQPTLIYQPQVVEHISATPSLPQPIQPILTHLTPDGLKEVPSKFERCETDDLIELIASMLDRLISHNDQIPLTTSSLTRFHSRSPPSITITDYLRRIYKYTSVEPVCLLSILPYIDRICERLASFTICSLTVHRFVITAVTVSSKSICDSFYANSRYAKVGGIGLGEMNLLEREFLISIDYRLITTGEVLNKYYLSLVHSHSSYTISKSELDPSNPSLCSIGTISGLEPIEQCKAGGRDEKIETDDQQLNEPKVIEESKCEQVKVPVVELQVSPDCINDEEME